MQLIPRLLLIFSISLCPSLSSGEEPFREFSNSEGKTIKARPVNIDGNKVRLAFEGGGEIIVSPTAFKQADETYLREWAIRFLASKKQLVSVSVVRKKDKVKDYKEDVVLVDGRVKENARIIKEFSGYYVITLENVSQFDLKSLRVDYRVFSKHDNRAKENLHDFKLERLNGTLIYDLKPQGSLTKKTEGIKLIESKTGQGIFFENRGDIKADATLVGVWLRIYNGEDMIHEFSLPSTLPESEKW